MQGSPGIPAPSKDQAPVRNSLREGVSALTLDFLAGTCLCVVCLESFMGKSLLSKLLPSFFKYIFSVIYLKNKEPKQRESRNSDRSEEGNDKITIQPTLKEQHLHHWQEKKLDSLLLTQFGIFLDHTYKQGRKWAFYICSLVFLTFKETTRPVFIQGF